MREKWRQIPGHVEWVSENGTVFRDGREVQSHLNNGGYPNVTLRRLDGTWSRWAIHKCVLNAWVGPAPDGAEARHLNCDRTDNRLSNLVWGSKAENYQDCVRNGCRVGIGERVKANQAVRRLAWEGTSHRRRVRRTAA